MNNKVIFAIVGFLIFIFLVVYGVAQSDGDNDGVPDHIDLCPSTSTFYTVDSNGCAATIEGSTGVDTTYEEELVDEEVESPFLEKIECPKLSKENCSQNKQCKLINKRKQKPKCVYLNESYIGCQKKIAGCYDVKGTRVQPGTLTFETFGSYLKQSACIKGLCKCSNGVYEKDVKQTSVNQSPSACNCIANTKWDPEEKCIEKGWRLCKLV
ncbi:hypothetical protein CMO93_03015 [Candidatus Woesearchaeota archaeon]|nr:hypothetical protein [Candidatus Woesearchaeota archaeon]|tara:strand:+ start:379 stop:1011 length:633 start_codon:yes stop_codon:yes gene_type:complete